MKYDRRSGNSYKVAVYKDGYGSSWKKWAKRQASKAVRRYEGPIPDGSAYKKIYNSWGICDFENDRRYRELSDWHHEHDGTNYLSK